jgi:hypothetical protein
MQDDEEALGAVEPEIARLDNAINSACSMPFPCYVRSLPFEGSGGGGRHFEPMQPTRAQRPLGYVRLYAKSTSAMVEDNLKPSHAATRNERHSKTATPGYYPNRSDYFVSSCVTLPSKPTTAANQEQEPAGGCGVGIQGRFTMAIKDGQTPSRMPPPRLRMAVVIVALVIIAAVASLYMIRMPGSVASTLASMFVF